MSGGVQWLQGATIVAKGGGLQDVYVRTLMRAVEMAGSEEVLAFQLKVTPSHLRLWVRGLAVPPRHVFLAAVDLVLADKTDST